MVAFEDKPPLYIRVSETGFTATKLGGASHFWIDTIHGEFLQGTYVYDFCGALVLAIFIPINGYTLVYYQIDQYIVTENCELRAYLSCVYRGDYFGMHKSRANTNFISETLPKPVYKARVNYDEVKREKITAAHHTHIDLKRLLKFLNKEQSVLAWHARRLPSDSSEAFVTGVILWLITADRDLVMEIIRTGLFDVKTVQEFIKQAKILSMRAKQLQHIVNKDLRGIFELDVLVNRVMYDVDWTMEKLNRTKPNLAKMRRGVVYDETVKILRRPDAFKRKPVKLSWDKFYKTRWEWSTSGSVHSQYIEDLALLPKEHTLRNKFIALISEGRNDINHYLSRRPEIHAWPSVKYEWGKTRAIYGTDLTSYVVATFGFLGCEDTLPQEFTIGKKAKEEFVDKKVSAILKGKIPLCVDFEDFNSQHSVEAMMEVMYAYRDVFRDELDEAQIEAINWSIASVGRMIIHGENVGMEQYEAVGTLLSGWRLTTFVNSVLNYVYSTRLVHGIGSDIHSVHNGDDVLFAITNFDTALQIFKGAGENNVRLQRGKCFLGGIKEFLRVDHGIEGNGQYIARAIATIVHSRIESMEAVSIVDLLEAMEGRLTELEARGGRRGVCDMIRQVYWDKLSEKNNMPTNELRKICMIHKVCGGVQLAHPSSVHWQVLAVPVATQVSLPIKLPGVDDYAASLAEDLKMQHAVDSIKRNVFSATQRHTLKVHYDVTVCENHNEGKSIVYRALYKAFKHLNTIPQYGKAAVAGMVMRFETKHPDMIVLRKRLEGASNVGELLSVLV